VLRCGAAVVHLNTSLNAKAWRDLVYLLVAARRRAVPQVHGGAWTASSSSCAALRWPDAVVVPRGASRTPGAVSCRAEHRLAAERHRLHAVPQARARFVRTSLWARYISRLHAGRRPRRGDRAGIGARKRCRRQPRHRRQRLRGSATARDGARLQSRSRCAAGPILGDAALFLSQTDALCLASYSEGIPYALLEAMAAGVVPIVTPVGGIPDVVQDGVHGAFVPVRDCDALAQAIEALARDRAALARMSAACRQRIAGAYSIERLTADFSSLYSSLCAPRGLKWAP
jgi:hypothetical protein